MTHKIGPDTEFQTVLDQGGGTDQAESESDNQDIIESNLTHSSRISFLFSQTAKTLCPQSFLNDSNVSSIMQVSFANLPEVSTLARYQSEINPDQESKVLKIESGHFVSEEEEQKKQHASTFKRVDARAPPMFTKKQYHVESPEEQYFDKEVKRDLFGAKDEGYFSTEDGPRVSEFNLMNQRQFHIESRGRPPRPNDRVRLSHGEGLEPEKASSPQFRDNFVRSNKLCRDGSTKDINAVSVNSIPFMKGFSHQNLRMIEEGANQENVSTARGFASQSKSRNSRREGEQTFEYELEHMRAVESDDGIDENFLTQRESIPDECEHASRKDYSTKGTTNCEVLRSDSDEGPQLAGTNQRYGPRRGFTIPLLPISGSQITPNERKPRGFVTPSTSTINRVSLYHSTSKEPQTYSRPAHTQKHSITSYPQTRQSYENFSNLDPQEQQQQRPVTPNTLYSGIKTAMNHSRLATNPFMTQNTSGLNSSRYSDIQRKKEEIEQEVNQLMSRRNGRNGMMMGGSRWNSVECTERGRVRNSKQLGLNGKKLSMDIPFTDSTSIVSTEQRLAASGSVPPPAARSFFLNQERMELQTSELIRKTEKLKQELLNQFEINEKSKRSAQNTPYALGAKYGNSPRILNPSQPPSAKSSQAPTMSSINQAIQRTIEATKDRNSQIISRVDNYKKEVNKIREDLNEVRVKNIFLQQKSYTYQQKNQDQAARVTRLEMKLRAKTQELNELQIGSSMFLEKVKAGQTKFALGLQHFKKQCEDRMSALLVRDTQLTKLYSVASEEADSLRHQFKLVKKQNNQRDVELQVAQERLAFLGPQLEIAIEEKKKLKEEVDQLRDLEKQLTERESHIKAAQNNYYKGLNSTTLQELRKFDQRQAVIIQHLNEKEICFTEEPKADQKQNPQDRNKTEGKSEYLKALKQKEELIYEMREFDKRRAKFFEQQAMNESNQKELEILRSLAKEKENTIKIAEKSASSQRVGYLVFGILMGMVLMSMLVRILI